MNSKNEKLSSAIKSLLQEDAKLGNAFNTADIKKMWSEYMPEEVTEYTKSVRFRSGKLTISISSAPLRQNLIFKADEIKAALNEKIKANPIKQLVFI